jgi:Flp pilus assembly protein TadD
MELRKAVAILLHQDGECAQAAGLYRQVLESGPEDAEILFDLGSALAALGRRDEAQDCWKQAIALRADLAPVLLAQLGESSLEVGIS